MGACTLIRRLGWGWVVAVGMIPGCGPGVATVGGTDTGADTGAVDPDPLRFAPFARSGERIVFDGVRLGDLEWVGATRDLAFDLPCRFETAGDGRMRCLPTDGGYNPRYRTADCSDVPVWVRSIDPTCAASPFQSVYPPEPCKTDAHDVFRMTPTDPPADDLYRLRASGCQPWTPDDADPVEFFVGALVDPAELVAGDLVSETTQDGLGVQLWLGEDGSRRVLYSWDDRYGPAGSLGDVLGKDVLTPITLGWADSNSFASPDCSGPRLASKGCPDGTPPASLGMWSREDENGDYVYGFAELGARVEAASRLEGDTCTDELTGDRLYYEQGPDVPLDAFHQITRAIVGGPQITGETQALATGEIVRVSGPMVDGESCALIRYQGETLCNLDEGWWSNWQEDFADPACSQPLYEVSESDPEPEGTRLWVPEPSCGSPRAALGFVELGVEWTGGLYEWVGGQCEPQVFVPVNHRVVEQIEPDDHLRVDWTRF